jgi:hypothetical protein
VHDVLNERAQEAKAAQERACIGCEKFVAHVRI